jgi:2,3-bisphosphoglycerate-independent phosphoglycerate mutase
MFDGNEKNYPEWEKLELAKRPKPKTSHSLSPVPFIVFDPNNMYKWKIDLDVKNPALGNFANTALMLMGLETCESYLPSIIKES